ncbi:MAG: RloB family protein [Gammaproteobacteria bacterium]|nr:RloB family protein [Gammaproteobacteria bacterium]
MARRPRHYTRAIQPKHEFHDRVLIVCEGKETEPSYLKELKVCNELGDASVTVAGLGSDPLTVVRHAKRIRARERRKGSEYDRVFCVFDRDEHSTFARAGNEAEASGLTLARSWPCFEYWLLLHFRYSRKPYVKAGNRSPAENCLGDLCKYLPEYAKATEGIYPALESRLEAAKARALRAMDEAQETEEPNPSTEIHELVSYLQSLKPPDS